MTNHPPQTPTAWDRACKIIDQMLDQQRELEQAWPGGFAVSESNRYWRKQLIDTGRALAGLRQAAISGQDIERREQFERDALHDYPNGDANPDTCPHPEPRISRRLNGDFLCTRCSEVVGSDPCGPLSLPAEEL